MGKAAWSDELVAAFEKGKRKGKKGKGKKKGKDKGKDRERVMLNMRMLRSCS